MEVPIFYLKLMVYFMGILSTYSVGSQLPHEQTCNDEYVCPSDSNSPFVLGHQYLYTFNTNSTLRIMSIEYHDDDTRTTKTISMMNSVVVTPTSRCEFVIGFSDPDETRVSMKVVLHDEVIHRVCSTSTGAGSDSSILTAIVPLLNFGHASIQFTEMTDVALEYGSKGVCISKIIKCGDTKTVAYTNNNKYCTKKSDAALNMKSKLSEFVNEVAEISGQIDLCSANYASPHLNGADSNGVTSCVYEVGSNNIIRSADCIDITEVNDIDTSGKFNGYASLKLKEVLMQNGSHAVVGSKNYFKTTIRQNIEGFFESRPDKDTITNDEFSVKLNYALALLTNSTTRDNMKAFEIQDIIIQARSLARRTTIEQDLMKFFEDLTKASESEKKTELFLILLAEEASSDAVLQFFQTVLSKNRLNNMSTSKLESILSKLVERIGSFKSTPFILKFCKFLFQFVEESTVGFTPTLKLLALTSFSEHVEKYCDYMQLITDKPFCQENVAAQALLNSTIIQRLASSSNLGRMMALEAYGMVKDHYTMQCADLYHSRKEVEDSFTLWTVLNCYRRNPCDKKGKLFFRSLLQNKAVPTNTGIAAFLGMMQCYDDKEDVSVIHNVLMDSDIQRSELQEFIAGYKQNRKFYNMEVPAVENFDEFFDRIMYRRTRSDNLGKLTRASNTFAAFKIPLASTKVQIETNMLYFDTPAILPEMITLSITNTATSPSSYYQRAAEIQIFINDNRKLAQGRSMLDFTVTIVARTGHRAVYMYEMELSQEKCIEMFLLLQTKLRNILVNRDSHGGGLQQKSNFNHYFPSITGIAQQISVETNGFTSLSFDKGDCSRVIAKNSDDIVDRGCRLKLNLVFHLWRKLSLNMGFPTASNGFDSNGFKHSSNFTAAFPLIVKVLPKELILELPLLSSLISTDKRLDGVKEDMDESSPSHIFSRNGSNFTTENSLKIVFSKDDQRKAIMTKIVTTSKQFVFEIGLDPMYYVKGNLTYTGALSESGNYFFEVGGKSSDDYKRLTAKVVHAENEYSMDAYYIRQLHNHNQGDHRHRGIFGCHQAQGSGLLCWWPFCFLCGTEYFVGAVVSTPRYRNVKIFEGSITQEFPNKKFDLVLKTSGIHSVHTGYMKVSISHGNTTDVISRVSMKEELDAKLVPLLPNTNTVNEDALPEAQSYNNTTISLYTFDWEIFNEFLGGVGLSSVYTYVPTDPYTFHVVAGELSYPTVTSSNETVSVMSVLSYQRGRENVTDYSTKVEGQLRSSQFPIVNTDLSVNGETTSSLNKEKTIIILRPIALSRGSIRLERIDNALNSSRNMYGHYGQSWTWENFHIDQTYKVSFPGQYLAKILKGKLVIKRKNDVTQEAGLEVLVGLENTLELRYDFMPEENNSFEVLTSITCNDEMYGLHHRLEQAESLTISDDKGRNGPSNYKYKGSYLIGESTLKATGMFEAKTGREILPFSKFDIRLSSVDGTDLGVRVFGSETITPTSIRNMKFVVQKDETNIFEFRNEINHSDQTPFKATIYLKDQAEVKISDSTDTSNKRNLLLKANWIPKKQLIHGKIGFPNGLQEPLYLDIDVTVNEELDQTTVVKLISSSSLSFVQNFSVTSKNALQLRNLKWGFGMEGSYLKMDDDGHYDDNGRWKYENQLNTTVLAYFIPPDLKQYSVETMLYKYKYYNYIGKDSGTKFFVRMERPDVTPLHLHFESGELSKYASNHSDDSPIDYSSSRFSNDKFVLRVCHKDNFLYLLPSLNADFTVEGIMEKKSDFVSYTSGLNDDRDVGRIFCRSVGILLPLCNQINTSYKSVSTYHDNYQGPWNTNLTIQNDVRDYIDEINVKMAATYDSLRPTRPNAPEDFDNIIETMLNTARDDTDLLKHTYSIDYFGRRTLIGNNGDSSIVGINGTYVITKVYETWDFFEFSDQHRWSQIGGGGLHIWTNMLNHTTDLNLTSESATFTSHYVSLGEGESSESNNITWMELRSSVNSNGFGTLKNIILQPSLALSSYEGRVDADFLVRSDFSPVNIFRLLVTHDHGKTENEDDEMSKNYETLTKLNAILNEREVTGTNSMRLAVGKMIGVANTLLGNYKSADGTYEYTVKSFGVSPMNICDNNTDNLIHMDVSSSWTNADYDDVDVRMSGDVMYSNGFPLIRFVHSMNSSDLEVERNTSVYLYRNVAKKNSLFWLPETVISDNLDDLGLSQVSLQSVSQQIIDDYYNSTGAEFGYKKDASFDYNFEIRSSSVVQNKTLNVKSHAKWLGFEERLFHCQSLYRTCADNGTYGTDHQLDFSNYCNLPMLPAKHFAVSMMFE